VARLEAQGRPVISRPWSVRNSQSELDKTDFDINIKAMEVTCPGGLTVPIRRLGEVVEFPEETCSVCPLRSKCTSRKNGAGRMWSVWPRMSPASSDCDKSPEQPREDRSYASEWTWSIAWPTSVNGGGIVRATVACGRTYSMSEERAPSRTWKPRSARSERASTGGPLSTW